MALPSSQPVTWLLCREVQMSRVRRTRQVPAGRLEPHPARPSQLDLRPLEDQALDSPPTSLPSCLWLPGLTRSRGLLGLCPVVGSQRLL